MPDNEQLAPDDRIAALEKTIATEKAGRTAADKAAAEANARAEGLVAGKVAADELAIKNGIAASASALESAKARYAEAAERGEFAAMATIQAEMVDATLNLNNFRANDKRLQDWKTRETARIAAEGQGTRQPAQHQVQQYSAETQAWLNRHSIDGQDVASAKMKRATAAHFAAEAEGLTRDTPEYFKYMDDFVAPGSRPSAESPYSEAADTVEVDLSTDKVTRTVERPAPALPPSRSTGNTSDRRLSNGKVRLTPGEIEAAKFSNRELYRTDPDAAIREYAENKAALMKEGIL